MNAVWVVQEHLIIIGVRPWLILSLGCVKNGTFRCQIWAKILTFSRCDSTSIAVRLFHIIHVPPVNAVWVVQEHLTAHWCQAMAHFELSRLCLKKWLLDAKSGQKLTLFQGVCQAIPYHPYTPMNAVWMAQEHLMAHWCHLQCFPMGCLNRKNNGY
jgi:hypothetical protein